MILLTPWSCTPSGLERRRYSMFFFKLFCRPLLIKSPQSLLLILWLLYFLLCYVVSLIPFHLFSSSSLPHFLHLPLRLDFHFPLPVHQLLSILTATWLPLSMLLKKNNKNSFDKKVKRTAIYVSEYVIRLAYRL